MGFSVFNSSNFSRYFMHCDVRLRSLWVLINLFVYVNWAVFCVLWDYWFHWIYLFYHNCCIWHLIVLYLFNVSITLQRNQPHIQFEEEEPVLEEPICYWKGRLTIEALTIMQVCKLVEKWYKKVLAPQGPFILLFEFQVEQCDFLV